MVEPIGRGHHHHPRHAGGVAAGQGMQVQVQPQGAQGMRCQEPQDTLSEGLQALLGETPEADLMGPIRENPELAAAIAENPNLVNDPQRLAGV